MEVERKNTARLGGRIWHGKGVRKARGREERKGISTKNKRRKSDQAEMKSLMADGVKLLTEKSAGRDLDIHTYMSIV